MATSEGSTLRSCERCGAAFPLPKGVPHKRFCSERCRRSAEHQRGMSYTSACKGCGVEFHPKRSDRKQYCSRECAYRTKAAKPETCGNCGQSFRIHWTDKGYGQYCSASCQEAARVRVCQRCHESFKTTSSQVRYCPSCTLQRFREAGRARYRANYVSKRVSNPVVSIKCAHCGKDFECKFRIARRVFCSPKCTQAAGKGVRRARQKGARREQQVYRTRIAQRDGWRCHLCGKPVARSEKAPHPLAPTLDHIVPLSCGGAHEPLNLRLAHFICNTKRSNQGPAQMLLL